MKRLKNTAVNKRSFTLTEVMIVISIIAFLAILVAMFLRTQIFKANDAKRKSEIKRIAIAAEEYEKDHDCYPLSSQVVCTNGGTGLRPYLEKIPCDPITNASYYYDQENNVCPKWYRLYSNLENKIDKDYEPGIGPNGAFSYEYSSPNAPDVVVYAAPTPSPSPVPNSTASPTPAGPTPSPQPQSFYGCFSGVCQVIQWNSLRPGPECDPNFQNSNCYGVCGNPINECQAWH